MNKKQPIKKRIKTSKSALDIACEFIRDETNYILYEKFGVWYLGIEVLYTIEVYSDHILILDIKGQVFYKEKTLNNLLDLGSVLKRLPISSWRGWGVANFDLANSIHNKDEKTKNKKILLTLLIPKNEMEFHDGYVDIISNEFDNISKYEDKLLIIDFSKITHGNSNVLLDEVEYEIKHQNSEQYMEAVTYALEDIRRGKYNKVILSRKICIDKPIDMVSSYKRGRINNTPARSFIVNVGEHDFMGFSPEVIAEVNNDGTVLTQPLAGTRSLTNDEAVNTLLRKSLYSDVKEIAEHAVSVKLAFEELESISQEGSVKVDEFMNISLRSTVQHLASLLHGKLREEIDCWGALHALFPAVTCSGIPKRESIDAITRYENEPRKAYSGGVILCDSNGCLDAALILRSIFRENDKFYLQAGAGIVSHSIPENELIETIHKLQSVSRFLVSLE